MQALALSISHMILSETGSIYIKWGDGCLYFDYVVGICLFEAYIPGLCFDIHFVII
jgi:hypothetical protein